MCGVCADLTLHRSSSRLRLTLVCLPGCTQLVLPGYPSQQLLTPPHVCCCLCVQQRKIQESARFQTLMESISKLEKGVEVQHQSAQL